MSYNAERMERESEARASGHDAECDEKNRIDRGSEATQTKLNGGVVLLRHRMNDRNERQSEMLLCRTNERESDVIEARRLLRSKHCGRGNLAF